MFFNGMMMHEFDLNQLNVIEMWNDNENRKKFQWLIKNNGLDDGQYDALSLLCSAVFHLAYTHTHIIFWLYKNRCDFWIFCSSFFVADAECEITIWMKCRFRRTRFKQTKRTVNRILTNKNGPIISTRVCYSTFSLPETERDRIEKNF